MPNRDGKGPEGEGPSTGRGKGLCTPDEMKDSINFKLFGKKKKKARSGKGKGKGLGRGPKDGTGNGRSEDGRGMRRDK